MKFNRGASRNAAAQAAGEWDCALFVDADVLIERRNIWRALDAAYLEDRVVFPHDRYHALSAMGRAERMTTAPTNGGALAISRVAWERVGGYDPRFTGWGHEDAAFYLATSTLLGDPIRLPGVMSEINHPKTGRARPEADAALYRRYKAARGDQVAMLSIVREASRLPA